MNQIASSRLTRKTPKDWDADLDDPLNRAGQLDDVPLRLTEERIRAETERIGNVEPTERDPKATSAVAAAEPPVSPRTSEPAPVSRPELSAGPVADAGEVTLQMAKQPDRCGSIRGLDASLRQPQSSAGASPNRVEQRSSVGTEIKERKNARRSGVLWGAVIALVVALVAESGYAYLAIRRNSVNLDQLPGAAVLRTVSAEMESARSKLQQSSMSADLNAVGHAAGATLNAAYQGARRVAGEVRDRYNQRHDR